MRCAVLIISVQLLLLLISHVWKVNSNKLYVVYEVANNVGYNANCLLLYVEYIVTELQ